MSEASEVNVQSEKEGQLLYALALMCQQYLQDRNGELDHQCMSAGEEAIQHLVDYGLVDPKRRGGGWTSQGRALLDSNRYSHPGLA